ncbi:MAG: hypothetical protein IKE57_00765 [Oscillospiraceae bacterium]|nr:hypothetical protein [Oscillospiraceae bacterium]
MKKLTAALLALLLLVSLAACGSKDTIPTPSISVSPSPSPSASATAEPAPSKAPAAVPDAPAPAEPSPSQEAPAPAGKTLETTYWTLVYDPDVWTFEEDDVTDSDTRSAVIMEIPDPEDPDDYLVNAEIRVSIGDPYSFRSNLISYGFDQYEYKVNNAYETTDVGGVGCLRQEGNYWGSPCVRYFNRVEGAKATVFLEIIGDYEDARVTDLLKGLTFRLPDLGNTDGPWYWEGEPFSGGSLTASVDDFSLTGEWVAMDEPIRITDTFAHTLAVAGDQVYILTEGVLKQYKLEGSALKYVGDVPLDGDYGTVDSDGGGSIWLSDFMEPLVSMKDGAQTASYSDVNRYVAMSPAGTWGIMWFSGPECQKVEISGGTASLTDVTYAEVKTIMHLNADADTVYVCGSAADDSGHKVFMYDAGGALKGTLESPDGLGSVVYVAHTANGYLALDGNMRTVCLWANDGTFIGELDDGDLFGTSYPWFCDADRLADGSFLVVMTEERADKSARELVAFKLSGF